MGPGRLRDGVERRQQPGAGFGLEEGRRAWLDDLLERDHGRPVELGGELLDASGRAVDPLPRVRRDRFPELRWADVDADLPVRQVGRLGRLLRLLRRGDHDGRGADTERECDRRERGAGTGLVADEIAQRQARRDREPAGQAREDADRRRAQEQTAQDRRHDPHDDQ